MVCFYIKINHVIDICEENFRSSNLKKIIDNIYFYQCSWEFKSFPDVNSSSVLKNINKISIKYFDQYFHHY